MSLGLGVWLSKTQAPLPPQAASTQDPRASAAELRSSGAGEQRVKELEERLDDQAKRIHELERRLERGEEQIVNFQVFVEKLSIESSGPAEAVGLSGSAPAEKAASSPPPAFPQFATGAPQAAVLGQLGPPDDRSEDELRYYEQGIRVLLDEFGAVDRVLLLGEATGGGPIDANGYYKGQFEAGGKWFRRARWHLEGVSMGTPGNDVVRHLGSPKSVERDSNGLFHLWYPNRSLLISLAEAAPHRVIRVRQGSSPPKFNANGGVD